MKVVISNPKNGKSYQIEIEKTKSRALYGMKLNEEIDGSLIGASGYKLKITGGTDVDGFPMRAGVHGSERKRILISAGAGIRKKRKGEKRKKTVRGSTISESIAQVNMVVVSPGSKTLPELLGISEKEVKKEGEKLEVKKDIEESKEEKEVKKVEKSRASATS